MGGLQNLLVVLGVDLGEADRLAESRFNHHPVGEFGSHQRASSCAGTVAFEREPETRYCRAGT